MYSRQTRCVGPYVAMPNIGPTPRVHWRRAKLLLRDHAKWTCFVKVILYSISFFFGKEQLMAGADLAFQ